MTKIYTILLLLVFTNFGLCKEDTNKVKKLQMYNLCYPASSSLGIPFNGAVILESVQTYSKGEFWYKINHLVKNPFFENIEVLASSDGAILGGRAIFSGTKKEWLSGEKGVDARIEVISDFTGGEKDFRKTMKKPMQVFNGEGDFGGMVFTFDHQGVSWRKIRGSEASVKDYENWTAKVKVADETKQENKSQ